MVQGVASIQGRVWRSGKPQDDFEFEKISDYLSEDNTLVWADLCDPDHDTLCDLAQELGLNQWAVEDAVAAAERVKSTAYESHTFFTVDAVDVVADSAESPQPMLSMQRISAFVLPRGLVTVRLTSDFDMARVVRRWEEIGGQQYGVGALVHGLLDVVVDSHFAAVEALDDRIEAIEDELFDGNSPKRSFQRRTFQMRRDLVTLRRIALPMREVVNSIQHHRLDAASARELDPLYADLYDHVLRVSEWTESLRDMITTIFETNLSLQDARLNTVMKKLTGCGRPSSPYRPRSRASTAKTSPTRASAASRVSSPAPA
jgi:magnesium transporter